MQVVRPLSTKLNKEVSLSIYSLVYKEETRHEAIGSCPRNSSPPSMELSAKSFLKRRAFK